MTPILDQQTLELISHSPGQTLRIGAHLASLLVGGEVIGLRGELGTGKTCLAQGIARGLGVEEPVTSPTFTLVHEYPLGKDSLRKLYHVDLYRLSRPLEEAAEIGLGEIVGSPGSIPVIEWAERVESVLPKQRLWVWLDFLDHTKRVIRLSGCGGRYQKLVQEFRGKIVGVKR